jgi:hypothetical protein
MLSEDFFSNFALPVFYACDPIRVIVKRFLFCKTYYKSYIENCGIENELGRGYGFFALI